MDSILIIEADKDEELGIKKSIIERMMSVTKKMIKAMKVTTHAIIASAIAALLLPFVY